MDASVSDQRSPDASSDGSDATVDAAAAANTGPRDIYASGGTPCVAAHSTVRALCGAYGGSLYQVRPASDGTTRDIGVLTPGGFADVAEQDSFCSGDTCTISILYDQSSQGNHLRSAPAGGQVRMPDTEANATALPSSVGGHSVYAIFIEPGVGYRNDTTSGIATGDQPEAEYMVTSGTHFNGQCCFDYGNAEISNNDTGAGHMEAVYFGTCPFWGNGTGNGRWVMGDLENGLFSGANVRLNYGNKKVPFPYVTAILKGGPGVWAIKAGDAQSGELTTMWNGVRPTGYSVMHKEGAILLGIGGDNSNGAAGTFYEGVMTSGYPADSVDDAVQANIVAAGYGSSPDGGPSSVSFY